MVPYSFLTGILRGESIIAGIWRDHFADAFTGGLALEFWGDEQMSDKKFSTTGQGNQT